VADLRDGISLSVRQDADTREDETVKCSACGGDGWYVGHEDKCYETGDCGCSGVQLQCEKCGGTGRV
jgi:hypothetical protein